MSYDQLFRVPFILGLISRVQAPGNTFSQYYGLGITGRVAQQILGRAGQYDIFDGTRSLSPMSAPGAPPTRLNRKPTGTQPITVPRIYNAIGIEDEKIFGTRSMGLNQAAPVNTGGQQYFTRQIAYAKQRMNNAHEFMATRMFAGGWTLVPQGTGSQLLNLGELGAAGAAVTNATLIPAEHRNQINGIIDASWDNAGADINAQLMALQVRAARVNGRRITDIWLNGNTAKYLFTNSVIQSIGGSVYRIWDTLNPATEIGPNQKFPDTGVTVQFRGLPDYKFHIYNQGYVLPGTGEGFTDQIGANWRPFIPDNVAIMTPSPGEWCGMVQGSEPVQWNLTQAGSVVVEGFGMGFERSIDPPRTDVKMVYNGAPVITEPYAVYYATVIF
jgi:hypothetical protein